jgi:hypothetical protein
MSATKLSYLEAVKIFQVEVFWVVTPCIVVVGYHRFRGLKFLYPITTLHGVTTQNTST